MAVSSSRLVRVLVAVVVVECAIALVAHSASAWQVSTGDAPPVRLPRGRRPAVGRRARRRRAAGRPPGRPARTAGPRAGPAPRGRGGPAAAPGRLTARVERVLAAPETMHPALQPIVDLTTGRWVAVEALARFPDDAPARAVVRRRPRGRHRCRAGAAGLPPGRADAAAAAPGCLAVGQRLARADPGPRLLLAPRGLRRGPRAARRRDHRARRRERLRGHPRRPAPAPAAGLRLAVDDTGAGYASFAHVLRLRPDTIKLDRSLLADIDHDAARRAFVTAIVLMALELGAAVTAEGVETAAELDTLRSLGVDTVQGFLIARPSTSPPAGQPGPTGTGWRPGVRPGRGGPAGTGRRVAILTYGEGRSRPKETCGPDPVAPRATAVLAGARAWTAGDPRRPPRRSGRRRPRAPARGARGRRGADADPARGPGRGRRRRGPHADRPARRRRERRGPGGGAGPPREPRRGRDLGPRSPR